MKAEPAKIPGSIATVNHFIATLEASPTDRAADREVPTLMGRMLMVSEEWGLPKAAFLSHVTRGRIPEAVAELRGWLARLERLAG